VINEDVGSFFYSVSLSCKILLSFGTAQNVLVFLDARL